MQRRGNTAPDTLLQDVYPCAGADAWVAVTVQTGSQRQALASLLCDAGLDTGDLDAALRAYLTGRNDESVVADLCGAGVPAGVVRRPTAAGRTDHVTARGFYEQQVHPAIGPVDYPILPTRFRSWHGPVHRRPAPTLGQHNTEVLGQELGIDSDMLAELERESVIGTRPAGL
jgi:crotonobetainyl-CoA:carnitine CoA-transferase CaiB-like acyl-CoA transferase